MFIIRNILLQYDDIIILIGEGQRPIFDRDDIRVNEEFHKLIIVTDPEQKSSEHGRPSVLQSDSWRKANRSSSRCHSRSSSVSSERGYSRQRKYSRDRSGSPQKKVFRNVKDEIKKSEWKKSRSRSPHYIQRSSGVSSPSKEKQYREYALSTINKSEHRRSRSRERRRSSSAERREHYSKKNRRDTHSPRRDTHSPRREIHSPRRDTHSPRRDSSYTEYRSHKRTPSPYKHRPLEAERYRKRSRSTSRTRSHRSRSPYKSERYHESSRRRSPHRSESRRDYRKHSRSPSRYERYKERPRRYSRSPSHEDRRYRKSPHRSRRRTPSPYKERRDRYPVPPPHLPPGPVMPINYAPQWYPWPQPPLGPRFIPPQGPLRLQRPPYPPIPPIPPMGQRQRFPIIYNSRSTNVTLVSKGPGILEAIPITTQTTATTSSTSTVTAATSSSTLAVSMNNAKPCESTNSSIHSTVESSSKDN